ncbi:hypothetical protein ROSINTL182_06504 [Roseburia intestinalis L1-82]|uniref:Uncharacterized protein n=1 Tax=Roseburia intestinalis L1-82 TaxID=536231 RepID=C7G9C5_9FIRM|nr:hypothetical protein ROSINTL182_06504 [Roseburia intestinalis L1-82]
MDVRVKCLKDFLNFARMSWNCAWNHIIYMINQNGKQYGQVEDT